MPNIVSLILRAGATRCSVPFCAAEGFEIDSPVLGSGKDEMSKAESRQRCNNAREVCRMERQGFIPWAVNVLRIGDQYANHAVTTISLRKHSQEYHRPSLGSR